MNAWKREHWTPGGGDALLLYVIYGDIDVEAPVSTKYRTFGLPDGLEVHRLTRAENGEYLANFEEGFVWDDLLAKNPALAAEVKRSSSCLVVRGEIADPSSLDYLRDAIGLTTFFLDHGGVTVHDPQVFKWWTPDDWRQEIFEPDAPQPREHSLILYSEEPGGTWFHTRGMRKFGRPDISVPDVPPDKFDAVVDLCNRLIVHQALGAVVPEGQRVRTELLPGGGVVHHGGDYEDDDFNNVHIEVELA